MLLSIPPLWPKTQNCRGTPKKAEALRRTSTSSVSRLLSRRSCTSSAASAFCAAVAAASSSSLQLRWCDAEFGSHTAMRRTRLRQAGNRLFLVFRRKSPPRLLCHLVPPGRYSIYRLVRDPGAMSIWASPGTMILVAGRTTGPRILTCQSDTGNDECSVSNRLDPRSGFSLPTPPFTTLSTSNAI